MHDLALPLRRERKGEEKRVGERGGEREGNEREEEGGVIHM